MQIWLAVNSKAHNFIPEEYWTDNYPMVEKMLPEAEIYVYEDDDFYAYYYMNKRRESQFIYLLC